MQRCPLGSSVRAEEQVAQGAPEQIGDAPLRQVMRPIVDHVAALAEAAQVAQPVSQIPSERGQCNMVQPSDILYNNSEFLTKLLEQVFSEISRLPEEDQGVIAQALMELMPNAAADLEWERLTQDPRPQRRVGPARSAASAPDSRLPERWNKPQSLRASMTTVAEIEKDRSP